MIFVLVMAVVVAVVAVVFYHAGRMTQSIDEELAKVDAEIARYRAEKKRRHDKDAS